MRGSCLRCILNLRTGEWGDGRTGVDAWPDEPDDALGWRSRHAGKRSGMALASASAVEAQPRPFFGRQADLDRLIGRAQATGLTAIVGRAQGGKTRLLQETRDSLMERGFIVGYAESTGEYTNLLLRALRDAYAHVSATDKLGVLLEKAKENPVGVLAGVSVAALAVILPDSLQRILDLTKRTVAEVESIGPELTRLTYDEAFSLVSYLATASEHPVVLFLDAWQKCSPVVEAAAPLQCFLDHSDAWPACHFFLGVGTDDPSCQDAKACLAELDRSSPLAEIRELGRMDLRDSGESQRLVSYLADEVPATREIEHTLTLRLLDGHPGVLHRWLKMKPETLKELEQLAEDAQRNRYPELRGFFVEQCLWAPRTARFLAALAVLPQQNDESVWRPLSLLLLKDLDQETVRALQADGILENGDGVDGVPSYGHDTRHDAARCTWLRHDERILQTIAGSEIKRLIPELAAHVTDLGWDSFVFAAALAAILEHQADLQLKGGLLLLCECAASLFPSRTEPPDVHAFRGKAVKTAQDYPHAATLVGMALASAQYLAGHEGDRACRDALFEELRELCTRHPDDAGVRERLAVVLVNTLNRASQDGDWARRDALLEELRELCVRHPEDAAVREQLAVALVNSVNQACRQKDRARRDALLKRLRRLCAEHLGDAAVRGRMAVALVNAANQACQEGDRACHDALLEELRGLYTEHAGDAAVRVQLAAALVNAVGQASQEGHRACRDALLEELRRLNTEHPGDAAVRVQLAMALVNSVRQAFWKGHRTRRDDLLGEFRGLYSEHPADVAVRSRLATALHNTVIHTCEEKDRACREALLDELRALCATHPEDETLRERLTMALFNAPTLRPPSQD
jgi:hypothetical protein